MQILVNMVPPTGELKNPTFTLEKYINVWYDNTKVFRIPKGFTFDGNSRPWLARFLVPAVGKDFPATILHDWHCVKSWTDGGISFRTVGDKRYLGAMKYYGVPFLHRYIRYGAVRLYTKYLELRGAYD